MQSRQVYKQEELTEQELKAAKNSYAVKRKTTKGRADRNGNPIEFRLTFEEWLSIWLASGKLLQRGIRQGQYCMSRKGDLGHYEVPNVFIQLSTQNSREGKLGRPSSLKGRTSPMKGRKQTEESNKKRREARLALAKKPCPHCARNFDPAAYGRFHGLRCKLASPTLP